MNSQDELRPEYDSSKLQGGVCGKYDAGATAATKRVFTKPDLAEAFPAEETVDGAWRLVASTDHTATLGRRPARAIKRRRSGPAWRRGRPGHGLSVDRARVNKSAREEK